MGHTPLFDIVGIPNKVRELNRFQDLKHFSKISVGMNIQGNLIAFLALEVEILAHALTFSL